MTAGQQALGSASQLVSVNNTVTLGDMGIFGMGFINMVPGTGTLLVPTYRGATISGVVCNGFAAPPGGWAFSVVGFFSKAFLQKIILQDTGAVLRTFLVENSSYSFSGGESIWAWATPFLNWVPADLGEVKTLQIFYNG